MVHVYVSIPKFENKQAATFGAIKLTISNITNSDDSPVKIATVKKNPEDIILFLKHCTLKWPLPVAAVWESGIITHTQTLSWGRNQIRISL